MEERLELELLSEKTLPQPANDQLLKYCPSMDLVALGSIDQQVLIYRLNGQRVYGATQKAGTLRVQSIRWKPNAGQLLAIAWSDGSVRLVGADSSKTVHQFTTGDSVTGVTCMGWTSNYTSRKSSLLRRKKGVTSWEDIFRRDDSLSMDNVGDLDLPRDLSLIDIEISLPKLSILAASGSSEEVFSSRSSLDPLFRPFDPKDNDAVDVMIVGTREGSLHLSIYDSFVIGSFSPVIIGSHSSYLVLHASNQHCSTHALLMRSPNSDGSLCFVPMDLRFVSASSDYLSLLASRSTTLQNLLRYIHHVQTLLICEWKGTQDLPARFIRNINETLDEDGGKDIVQALYHAVATGHMFPVVREWLVDELAERGHKRWDKAVVTGLENIRRLVHENMLPALDRCSVILSRFAGIAKFHGSNDNLGFTSQQISLVTQTVACLHLVASKILMQTVEELDLFAAFSAWLRHEIDRLASDTSSSANEEANEKEASLDHGKVLLYLKTSMNSSPLAIYFADDSDKDFNTLADPGRRDGTLFVLLEEQLRKQEQGLPYMKPLLRIHLLCGYLTQQASAIFKQIAEAEKRNVLFGKPHDLGVAQEGAPMDMKMSQAVCLLLCLSFPKIISVNHLKIYQVAMLIENGISTVTQTTLSIIELGSGKIKDVKFSNDIFISVLWEIEGHTHLLSIPYKGPLYKNEPDCILEYSPFGPKAKIPPPFIFDNASIVEHFSKYKIPGEDTFKPAKLEIREQTEYGWKEDMKRVLVLAEDKLHYKVFKLPATNQGSAELDGDTQMS
ncbi:anaphase-promoting complex, cyclosome, subunit 4-domain-containing protein [Bisporella sp. PMI_857]|nr:anaphase-promoting complex, cyclosome, subunit 4-domain-containing protein [Bisporella sp. PMI_857]